jgi:hypothetical protein
MAQRGSAAVRFRSACSPLLLGFSRSGGAYGTRPIRRVTDGDTPLKQGANQVQMACSSPTRLPLREASSKRRRSDKVVGLPPLRIAN